LSTCTEGQQLKLYIFHRKTSHCLLDKFKYFLFVFSSSLLLLMSLHKYYSGYQNSSTYTTSTIRWLLQLPLKRVPFHAAYHEPMHLTESSNTVTYNTNITTQIPVDRKLPFGAHRHSKGILCKFHCILFPIFFVTYT
jgi:hypothetical protein